MLPDVPGHGMHQVRLAEPDSAVKKERIERHRMNRADTGFRDAPCCRMRKFVGLPDHKILEKEPVIQRQVLRPLVADFERCSRV